MDVNKVPVSKSTISIILLGLSSFVLIGAIFVFTSALPWGFDTYIFVVPTCVGIVLDLFILPYDFPSAARLTVREDGMNFAPGRAVKDSWITLTLCLAFLAGAVCCARWYFFDFLSGSVRINAEGITIRVGLKKRTHKWTELTDFGIVPVNFSFTYNAPMYWLYLSRTPLTPEEKIHFKKHRHELDWLAYFECKPGVFHELQKYAPPEWRAKLWSMVE